MRSAVWLARTKSGSRPSRHSSNDSGLMRKPLYLQRGAHRPCYPTSMCGRYTLTVDKSTIEKHFGAKFYMAQASYDYEATYNAAPSQMLPIIRTYATDRIELARWGFWPDAGWPM